MSIEEGNSGGVSRGVEPQWAACFSWADILHNPLGFFFPYIERVLQRMLLGGTNCHPRFQGRALEAAYISWLVFNFQYPGQLSPWLNNLPELYVLITKLQATDSRSFLYCPQ